MCNRLKELRKAKGLTLEALGTVSGMGGARRAVVWLDAHPDFRTPDTTSTAFLDGMGTAILAGEAWRVGKVLDPSIDSPRA